MAFKPVWILLALLATSLLLVGCIANPPQAAVQLGLQLTPASSLVQIAKEKGFFEKNGVNVEIKEFTAGKFAFQAMLANSADLSVVGDIPVALAKLQGNDFVVLAQIGENYNEAPVIVRDDGSATPQEYFLKTKRKLSTSLGGTPEFSTYLFLKEFNIPVSQVEIIAQKPEEMVGALASGSVDAIAIFEPYPSLAEQTLLGKTKRFTLPAGVYPTAYLLAANTEWVEKNPEKAVAVLKALKEAKDFAKQNPVESQQIVSKYTKFESAIIQKIWSDFDLRVWLSDHLVDTWQKETAWAVETGKINPTPVPDFTTLFRPDLLQAAQAQ